LFQQQIKPILPAQFQMGNGFIPQRPPGNNQSTPSSSFNITAFLESFATYYGIPSFLFPGYYQMGNYYHLPTTTTTVASTAAAIAGVTPSTTSTVSPSSTDNQPCLQVSIAAVDLTTSTSLIDPLTTNLLDGDPVTDSSTPDGSKPSKKPTPPIGLPQPVKPPASQFFFPIVSSGTSSSSSSSSSDGSVSSGGIIGSVTSSGSTVSVTGFLLFFFFIALPIIFGCLTLLEIPYVVSGVLVLAVAPLTLILFLKVSGAFHGRNNRRWTVDWKRIISDPDAELRRLEQDVLALLESFPYREMETTTTLDWNHLDDYSR
jgi:hypothetical protein